MIDEICTRLDVIPIEPLANSRVGIAIETLSMRPIHGLRNPVEDDMNGWYFWCGEWSDAPDFFKPLHLEHLNEYLPQVLKYLQLPPGYRILIDDNGYEDIWFDDSCIHLP